MEKKLQEATPFFIIGNPRSGTTLLRLMLNQHDEIVVPPECGFSVWLSDQFEVKDFSSDQVKMEFVSQVVKSRKFETWGLNEQEINDFVQHQQCHSYQEAVLAIYLFYAFKNGRTPHLVGDKNNFYINHLEKIDSLFDAPKYIFIVRDGRDVACSYLALQSIDITSKYSPRLSGEIMEIAKEWTANNTRIISYLDGFPERSLLIKYEKLISAPETELVQVCEFFDIEYQPKMLTYYKNNDEPNDFLVWKKKTLLPPDSTNFGMYKKLLPTDEIKTFNDLAKAPLSYFGYC
jgi:hypothetical protein